MRASFLLLMFGCGGPPEPMLEEKVELGRHLFYDKRLSQNQTQACASCHKQSRAFTDGRAQALGSTGEDHPRSSMSLVNLTHFTTYGWTSPTVRELEQQATVPLFGEDPIELGMSGLEELLLQRLRAEPRYRTLRPFSIDGVLGAIAAFERTLISDDSAYDRYARGDYGALSEEAGRGRVRFNSEDLGCSACHSGSNFSDSAFHITAAGLFRTPTLRNIARTAPYLHDGSIATLEEVLVRHEPVANERDRADVIAFLESLTDESFLSNPSFSNPWSTR